ncbi:MAG: hypothetical protein LBI53_08095 [Candidatus Peribacteria bacterium]|jgi:hypothetical protein|nr:hypothetical protein [Candidatus Peribacteria bacterium]
MQSGKILKGDYDKLVAIPIVNGNEESSPRDLQTKPTQMSNRVDSDKAFVYEE